jgi:UDP-glucuronate 4-epimerase
MIFITGTAGFIGFHLTKTLLEKGESVVGFDSINDYYDDSVKYARLAELGLDPAQAQEMGTHVKSEKYDCFTFVRGKLEDYALLDELFGEFPITRVVNLAAQAGVRYSLINPLAYINSNVVGFTNILEVCRHHKVRHLAYASSSSVYGLNDKMPLSTRDNVDHPVSLYAATKKSNELMAHTYSHLFGLPTTGLRFFTVYGPWGRPDMALFLFTEAILKGEPIKVFNHGEMVRDFTYVDDIVEGIIRVVNIPPTGNQEWSGSAPDPQSSPAPWRVYNIGNNDPVRLLDFVEAIEIKLGKKAERIMMDLQPGDVPATYADVADLMADIRYKPETPLKTGIDRFIEWYRIYYKVGLSE